MSEDQAPIPRPDRRKAECVNGHDLTLPENVYTSPAGKRQCRVCKRVRARTAHRRKVGLPLDAPVLAEKHLLDKARVRAMLDGSHSPPPGRL